MIVLAVILEGVLRVGLVDHRRAGLERLLDVEHRRELLVVDPHLGERLERLALGAGDDRHDRLALVAHLVGRERRLVVLAEVQEREQRVEIARHIRAADDAAHARHALRLARIDAADARVMMRRTQHLQVQQAGELVVVEERGCAGDMADHVLALGRLADLFQVVVALVGEIFFAQFQHHISFRRAAGCRQRPDTALMIGS